MTIICLYRKINSGWLVVIELDAKRFVHDRFVEFEDATMWASSFCEGYVKALEDMQNG